MEIYKTSELIGKSSRLLTKLMSLELLKSNMGITSEQWILLQLLHNRSMNQKEIGELTLKNKATISSLVTYLFKSGLINKTKSKRDKRQMILSITKKGKSLLEQSNSHAFKSITKATIDFSEIEINVLNNYLTRVINNLME